LAVFGNLSTLGFYLRSVSLVLMTLTLATLAGCGGVSMVEVNEESRLLVAEAAARDRMLALREAALKRREKELSNLETRVSDSESSPVDGSRNQLALSSSDSNGCVAALFIPAQLNKGPMEFLATPSYESVLVTPASFDTTEQLAFVGQKPVNSNITVDYRSRFEKLVVRPAHHRSTPQKATFEKVATTVVLKPEYLDWQPCADNAAFCATKQQAELTVVEHQVLTKSLRLNTQLLPPLVQEIEVKTPIQREQSIPGGYTNVYMPVQVQTLAADEKTLVERVPSTRTTIETSILREAARVELRPVICSKEMQADGASGTTGLLGRLRAGLNTAGYEVAKRGGFDAELKKALRRYQRDNDFALSDDLPSIESLAALGAYP
jgi:hypothetical protein